MRRAAVAMAATMLGLILLLTFRPHSRAGPSSAAPSFSAPPTPSTSPSRPVLVLPPGTHVGTGDAVTTQYGQVQVQVTVVDGRITRATALRYPNAVEMDVELSRPAVAQLEREVIAAQSADVDSVSGATYTSQGYLDSLQSALDKLHA